MADKEPTTAPPPTNSGKPSYRETNKEESGSNRESK
jgi:hypothetical protein